MMYILLIQINSEFNNITSCYPCNVFEPLLSFQQRLKILISACEPKHIIIRVLDNTIRLQPGQRERERERD